MLVLEMETLCLQIHTLLLQKVDPLQKEGTQLLKPFRQCFILFNRVDNWNKKNVIPSTPKASPPRAIPIALPLSLSSGYLSANIPIPVESGTNKHGWLCRK